MPNSIYMKRNLNIFLTGAIPFGLFMGLLNAYLYGLTAGLLSGLISGLILGVLMLFILGFLHSRGVKRVRGGNLSAETGTQHIRNATLCLPYDQGFDLCIESLKLIKNCTIQVEDRLQGKLIAKAGLNWKTWSDTIAFDIKGTDDNHTQITVSSRPTARTTIVDFGKNLENVERIISFLPGD